MDWPNSYKYRFDFLFVLLIVALGLLGVFYKLDVTPPGGYPWSDESEIAADAVESVRHGWQFFYPAQLAGGSAAVWLEASWITLFGKGLTGLRLLNGLVNLVSVLLLYLLVRQLPFNEQTIWPRSGPTFSQWLGLTAALFFAGSTWILGLARLATPNWSLVPLMATLTFYLLWRALKTNRWGYFVATGAVMGLAFYGYIPGYAVPLVPAIFLGLMWFSKPSKLPHPPFRLWVLPFLVAFVVALPILIFFAFNLVAVTQRVEQLTYTNQISDTGLVAWSVVDTLSTFGIWPNWILQGEFDRVAFDPFLTGLFVIGLVIAIRRRPDPVYLFLLIWWAVMIAPAFLSRSASIGFIFEMWRRGIGAQPVSFIFPALTVMGVAQGLQKLLVARSQTGVTRSQTPVWERDGARNSVSTERDKQSLPDKTVTNREIDNELVESGAKRPDRFQAVILPVVIAVSVAISVGWSYQLYFERWANSGTISMLFPAGPVRLVEWMEAEGKADTLFIFPTRPDVSPTTRPELFTVRYLFDGQASTAIPPVDEATLNQTLAGLLVQYQPAIVHLMLHNRIDVDPKAYLTYALGRRGEIVSRQQQPDYNVFTYRLHDDLPAEAREEAMLQPVNVGFGDKLRLIGHHIQPEQAAAGRSLGVALQWVSVTGRPEAADYNVSLTLYNPQGDVISQADKPLLSPEEYLTTRYWQPGAESTIYYTVSIPPDAPPGRYTLRVVAYNVETGERLSPEEGQADLSYPLAEVQVQPNPAPIDPTALTIAQPLKAQVAGGLHLVGVAGPAVTVLNPGDTLRLTALWQVTEPLLKDIGIMLGLAGSEGELVPLFEAPQPLITDYPATEWPVGAVYRTNYGNRLPARLTGNDYMLALRLFDLETGESLGGQLLFPITVQSRTHVFEASVLANGLDVDFGDTIRLRGFEFGQKTPEGTLRLKLQWQALREMPESYKVFLHLTDAAGQIVAQVDTLPRQGEMPTTGWVSGEIIEDELILSPPPDMPIDSYQLLIGLYNEATGERLMTDQGDHWVLIENGEVR